MIQAITTSFVNDQKNRVQAICEDGNLALPYRAKWDAETNLQRAALALFKKMGWQGTLHRCTVSRSSEQVWAVIPEWMSDFSRRCESNDVYVAGAMWSMIQAGQASA